MSDRDLEESLVKWVNTFEDLSSPCETLGDLSDGVLLSEILYQISNHAFPAPVLRSEDLHQRLITLTELSRNLRSFYNEVLGQAVNVSAIDLAAVAQGDFPSILGLVELVLGCAVQCDNKNTYIGNIMTLDTDSQAQLMILIEGIINGTSAVLSSGSGGRRSTTYDEPDVGSPRSPRYQQRSEVDEAEIQRLTAENTRLLQELEVIKTEHATSAEEHKDAAGKMNEERNQWNKLLAQQKAEIDRIKKSSVMAESQSQEFRVEMQEKERTISDLKQKVAELSKAAQENRSLRDELDILKAKLSQSARDDAALEKYKRIAQTASDLKKQLKESEDQINSYIEKNLDLEEQLKRVPTLKAQVENYKQQLVALETKASDLQVSLQKKDFEVNKANESIRTLTQDRDRQRTELDAARAKLSRQNDLAQDFGGSERESLGFSEVMTPEIKEKLARLERENKMLKSTSQESERLELLEVQLEDATRLKDRFEKQYLSAHEKTLHLESEVQSLEARISDLEVESASKTREVTSAVVTTRIEHSDLQNQIDALQQECDSLRAELVKAHTEKATGVTKEALENLRAENDKLTATIEKHIEDIERLSAECDQYQAESRRNLEELNAVLKEKDKLSQQYMTVREQIAVQDRTVAEQQVALQHKTNEARRIAEENQSLTAIAKHASEQLNALQERLAEKENLLYQLQFQTDKDKTKDRSSIKELEGKLQSAGTEIANLMADKVRLESYMKQAKAVIVKQQEDWKIKQKEARAKDSEKYEASIEALTNQLKEKEALIEQLKKSREEEKSMMKRESKLVMSAFYEMGMDLLKMRALPRALSPAPTSPLGRLRHQLT